jgi:uncharacterized membrane protein YphA (DoxX/SURF4 family)
MAGYVRGMTVTRALARPMLAGIFVYGGLDSVRHPERKVPAADEVGRAIARPLGLPEDTETLVRVNGGVQVAAGTLLAVGKLPRVSALALAGSLVPTTLAGHPFWKEQDPQRRAQQQIQLLKNLAMLGGLLLAAVDTAGRPSVPGRTRRVLKQAKGAAEVGGRLPSQVRQRAKRVVVATSESAREAARDAALAAAGAATIKSLRRAKAAVPSHVVSEVVRGTVDRTRQSLRDGALDHLRESAAGIAHETRDRAVQVGAAIAV